MSISETDESTDVYDDCYEPSLEYTDNESVSSYHFEYDDDEDDSEEDIFSSYSHVETKTTGNNFIWNDDLKQAFSEFFEAKFPTECILFVEEFARRNGVNDSAMRDLLELLKKIFAKTICSNCNSSSISCQSEVLDVAISNKAVPDSTNSIPSVNIDSKNSSVDVSLNGTCQKKEVQATDNCQLKRVEMDVPKAEPIDVPMPSTSEKDPKSVGRATEASNNVTSPKRKLNYTEGPSTKILILMSNMEARENGHLFCPVCEVSCTGEESARQHLQGKAHEKNSKRKTVPECLKSAPESKCIRGKDDDTVDKIYCEVCDVHISGEDNAKAHYSGKKHSKNKKLKRFPKISLKESSATVSSVLPISDIRHSASSTTTSTSSVSRIPATSMVPDNVGEIASDENATQKLRKLFIEGQKKVDNELDDKN